MNGLGAYRYINIGKHMHIGSTATYETPAICEDCGRPYGNALGHNAVKTEAKAATCTEGYAGDKVCKVCGEVIEQGKAVPKVAHSYKDGKCTVCGAADPNYNPDIDSPQTGDNSNVFLWVVLLFVTGDILSAVTYSKKKQPE